MGCAGRRVARLHLTIQHIAHDLIEKRGKTESNAIQMAVGIVKRWCRGGGNVDANTRAAACKAASEWEAKKASSHARSALQHSEGKWRVPSLADELAVREAALVRLGILEAEVGRGALVALLDGSALLAEGEAGDGRGVELLEALGRSVTFDVLTLSHVPPVDRLRREAEARLPVPLAERFSAGELRDFRGRWRTGAARILRGPEGITNVLGLTPTTPEELHATASRPAVGRAEKLRRHGRRSVSSRHELPLHLGGVRSAAVRQALGSHRDTREKYSTLKGGKRVYTKERKAQHRKLIEELFRESGARVQPEGQRHVVFVAGGPGSGKSSAEEYMPKHPHSVEIDQDYFKNKIREFQKLAAAKDPYASDAAHREAADIAHQARVEAMRRGYNVVVQGAGDSGAGQFARKIVEARESGYRPHAFYVSAPTEIALERARSRAAATGRSVPEAGARAMHANVSRRFSEVARVAHALESLQVFDSREDTRKGGKARLMMHLDPVTRRIVHDNPKLAAEFLAKRHENPGTLIRKPSYV